ncbi:MAG: TonB-dependent receptor [Winogradskyella sp.]|uniref:TonB-dependent receptor n=1 Tax=Winogradskyella sp. TaxID=1883156 RepID=UPI001834D62B|nr:carboxypeptidase regulatory-like domain-containing protein [Winogradskyella sp.]MBT8245782.1 carboxypeptidase regulatory-like domain-containing protein [Winogradskyella sp.]NNK23352.1 TonB-dependent receptor [Winogradskyella sp.]
MKKITQFLVMTVAMLFATMSFAQGVTTSSMGGQVTDEAGEPLPGATVVAIHLPTGSKYGAATDFDGYYRMSNMRASGPYTVTISYVGFKEFKRENVFLQLGNTERISVQLKEDASVLDEVVITANRTGIFDSNKTGASTNISNRQITTLPTVSRSIADFVRVTPQAQISEGTDGFSISLAGQNNRYNAIYVDGAVNNDVFGLAGSGTNGGQTGVNPFSIDAIESFQVAIAPFDVKISGFAGGAISAVTRSGTNEWTGSLYGFLRNQDLAAKTPPDLVSTGNSREKLGDFNAYNYGFRVGGPIVKDKLFMFLNYEREDRETPQPFDVGIYTGDSDVAMLNQLSDFVQNTYGYSLGGFDGSAQTLVSNRITTKFDWNINDNNKLTLSWRYTDAENLEARSSNANSIGFINGSELFNSVTNSATLELNSIIGNRFANSFIVGYTGVRDDRDPAGSPFPSVQISDGLNPFSGQGISFGAERFSTANLLNTDVLTITNNFEIYSGRHTVTIGTHNEFTTAKNLFFPSNYGYYIYDTVDDFINGAEPFVYETGYSVADSNRAVGDESSGSADFKFAQLGFYVQDEVQFSDNFKVSAGLRFDVPIWENGAVNDDFNTNAVAAFEAAGKDLQGARVGKKVNTTVHISPRIGFNWDVKGEGKTQIRGGLGIFTSRLPLVWPGGTYNNNGGATGGFTDEGDVTGPITFNPDVNTQFQHLVAGSNDFGGNVDLFAEDFMLPQIFKMNIAVDQKLPFWGLIASGDFIWNENINAIFYENLNTAAPTDNLEGPGDTRPKYGSRVTGDYGRVILASNTGEGHSWNASFTLTKPTENGFNGSLTYSYGEAESIFDGTSSQNSSQWRNIQTVNGKNSPDLSRSDFAQGHRILATVGKEFKWNDNVKTYIGLVYEGLNGQPFSHVYSGRRLLNDDSRDNALIYVPANQSEINLQDQNANGTADEWAALNAYIEGDDYLRSRRGNYAERNGDRNPWSNVVDLKFLQDFSFDINDKKHTLQLSLDIFNFTNLVNKDWGKRFVNFNNFSFLENVSTSNGETNPVFRFRDNASREVIDDIGLLSSRWQMQVGLRYSF